MAEVDGSIVIDTRLKLDDFKAGTKEITDAIKSFQDSVANTSDTMGNAILAVLKNIDGNVTSITDKVSGISGGMEDFQGAAQNAEGATDKIKTDAQGTAEALNNAAQAAEKINNASTNKPANTETGDLGAIVPPVEEVRETSTAFDELTRKVQRYRDAIMAEGYGSEWIQALAKELEHTSAEIDKLIDKKEQMEREGISDANEGQYNKITSQIAYLKHEYGQLHTVMEQAMQLPEPPKIPEAWSNAATFTNMLKQSFDELRNSAQLAFYGMQHPLGTIDRLLASATTTVGNLGQRAVSALGQAAGSALKFAKSLATSAINKAVEGIKNLGSQALNAVKNLAKMAGSGAITFLKKLADGAKNAAIQLAKMAGNAITTGVKKLGSTVGNLTKSLFGLGKSANSTGMSFKQGLNFIIRYGLGVRSLYALVNKLRTAFVAAFQNMAQQIPSVNATISGLVSSLAQLKASLATAFQPIVSVVAPYLNQLMAMLSQAMTKIGEFFAALTGQKFVYKANKPNIDYAKANQTAAQKAAQKQQEKEQKAQQQALKKQQQEELAKQKAEVKAQNDAEKARVKAEKDALKAEKGRRKEMEKTTKEANRQLASFDNLNILEDTSKDDAADTSDLDDAIAAINADLQDLPTAADIMSSLPSGTEIADYITPDVTYEKIPIESAIADFAKRIKDALSKGNLYDIGKDLAEKLNKWIGGIKWAELGKKVGKGINSIVSLLNGFFDNFKWRQLGKDFAKFVNSILGTVDFYELGRLMTQKIAAITKVLNGFFHDLDWESLGRAIADFAEGLMTIPWDLIGDTIGTAITGIFTALYTAATRFDWKSAGEKVASGVDKMFDAIDWVIISNALIALMNGALDAMIAFVDTFPWAQHGEELAKGVMIFINEFPAEKAATALTGFIKGVLDFILPTISDPSFWTGIGSKFAEFVNGVFTDEDMWDKVEQLLENLINGIFASIKTFFEDFKAEEIGQIFADKFRTLVEKINEQDIADALTGAIKALLDLILPTLTDETTWVLIGAKFASLVHKVFDDKEMWNKLKTALKAAIKAAITVIKTFLGSFEWGTEGEKFKNKILELQDEFPKDELSDAFRDLLKSALEFMLGAFADGQIIGQFATDAASFFNDIFEDDDLMTKVGDAAYGMLNSILTFGENFLKEFKPAEAAEGIKTALGEIPWDDVTSRAWELLKTAAGGIMEFVCALFGVDSGQSIGTIAEQIGGKIGEILNGVPWSDIFTTVKDTIFGLGKGLIDELLGGNGKVLVWVIGGFAALKLGILPLIAKLLAGIGGGIIAGGPILEAAVVAAFGGAVYKLTSLGIEILGQQKELNAALRDEADKGLTRYVELYETKGAEVANEFANSCYHVGLEGKNLRDNLEQLGIAIAETQGTAFDSIAADAAIAAEAYKTLALDAKNGGMEVANSWAESVLGIKLTSDDLQDNMESVSAAVRGLASDGTADVKAIISDACAGIITEGTNAGTELETSVETAATDIKTATAEAGTATKDNLVNPLNEASTEIPVSLDTLSQAFDESANSINTSAQNITYADILSEQLASAGDNTELRLAILEEAFGSTSENIVNKTTEGTTKVKEAYSTGLAETEQQGKVALDAITTDVNTAADNINSAAERINIAEKLHNDLSEANLSAQDKIEILKSTLSTAMDEMNTNTSMSSKEMKETYKALYHELVQTGTELWPTLSRDQKREMLNMRKEMKASARDIATTAQEHGNEIKETLSGAYSETSTNVKNSTNEMKTDVTTDMSDMSTVVKESSESVKGDLPSAYDEAGKGVTDAVSTMESNVDSKMGDIKSDISSGNNSVEKQTEPYFYIWNTIIDIVETAMDILKSTVDSGMGNIASTVKNRARDVESAFKSLDWTSVGSDIVRGIESGLNGSWPALESAVRQKAQQLLQTAKNSLGIHSPSRLFRDEVGQMVGEGLALGIDDSQANVLSSVADMATSMVDEMQDTDMTADFSANGDTMLNGLSNVLSTFSLNVENSFINLIDRLQAIAESVTYQEPAIAGSVLPYAVQGTANVDTQDMSIAMNQSNEELISVLMQLVNNQTSALLRGMEQYCTTNVNIDKKSLTDSVIEEINRRTRAMGASPLVI